ncbi:MAG TPA: YceK/YidQ family lipoprotein, partial [Nitrospirota bacterium]|nr:YceK/YidQ family lipoprotein [Nitrospirota bacterium]
GCATLTTASHFTKDSPKFYSGTRLDMHARALHEDALLAYKDKYGVDPPDYPGIDLPFSLLFDTVILVPIVLPVVLYQAVFDRP